METEKNTENVWKAEQKNKEYVEKLLNLIMILVQEIPVYRLINRADHDSVEIVKKELQKEVI